MDDASTSATVDAPAANRRRTPGVVRGVVFVALFCSALTSPYLERGTSDHLDSEALIADPAVIATSTTSTPPATPATAATQTVPVATSPTVPASTTSPHVGAGGDWRSALWSEYVVADVGCATDLSAAGLAAFFAQPLGAIEGFDGPRIYPLGDGRNLWVLQDTFVDYYGGQTSFAHMDYANSSALIQDGACFTSVQRGTPTDVESFEQGNGDINFDHYFWPAGGTVRDGTLQMFWMEMVRDPKTGGPLDGIALHPAVTWLATYDLASLERISFVPAPNSGVSPVYGYTVVDDGDWSYLFANSYQQNLALEGGYANGPHSATRMYLARVPRGHLDDEPEYWNGSDWSAFAAEAAPISSRNFTENSMLPSVINGTWVSATKVDGFTGSTITIDVAADPWGPYLTALTLPATPRGDPSDIVTYHALVLPWLDPVNGQLVVSLSQIPLALGADDAPAKYRPNFFDVDLSAVAAGETTTTTDSTATTAG